MDFIELENKILKFWQEKKIFEKLRKKIRGKKPWSFLDGPITANNPMAVHHAWGRTYKDIFQRYFAMKGRDQRFQNGFDCQGLWVEVEVEKDLGFKNKKDIENYGIANFVEKCKERVKKYSQIQTNQSIRLGQWMDWENSYYTMSNVNNYAIWHFLKECHKKGLLYKGRDVVPWCLRCGTAISQHEILTEEYKEITHKSVFLKFPLIDQNGSINSPYKNTYLLVWTTTPWTLPANVACAINPKKIYVKIRINNGYLIFIKSRLEIIKEQYSIIEEFTGEKLLAQKITYKGPFYDLASAKNINYRLIEWDEVSSEEGTGIVHIAPGCGQEDFALSKTEKLDVIDPIDEEGIYKKEFGFLAGKSVTAVNEIIFQDLEKKGFIYKIEDYSHRYPTCWRCKSELIFRLVDEWYIAMGKPSKAKSKKQKAKSEKNLREKMTQIAKKIKWIPCFGLERELDWLKNMRDWLISKKRYWGLALPIFECQCGNFELIGCEEEMIKKAASSNNYFILRHPEATHNIADIIAAGDDSIADKSHLTVKGKKDLLKITKILKKKKIDLIVASDIYRIKEVCKHLAKELKIPLFYDRRLRDINCGVFNGKPVSTRRKFFKKPIDKFYITPERAENLTDVKMRMMETLNDTDKKYSNKNILIVSHGDPLWILEGAVRGFANEKILKYPYIKLGELKTLPFKPLPYNPQGELEPHRPYIDNLKIKCSKCGKNVHRILDVGNPWLDAGIVPFSTMGYFDKFVSPVREFFSNGVKNTAGKIISGKKYWQTWFPAELVCESFPGQFRNWFYSIIAMAAVLENKPPVKTIFGYASVRDEKGEEMHKSKGNAIWFDDAVEKIGADIMRFMYAKANPEINLNFGFRTAEETKRQLLIFFNIFTFFITYVSKKELSSFKDSCPKASNLLDKWIISRLNNLIKEIDQYFYSYDITKAAAKMEKFIIDDFSTWYLRRSRRRFQKPANRAEKKEAASVFYYVFINFLKLLAPIMPFWTEEIYQNLKNKKDSESIHLCDWPQSEKKLIDEPLEKSMEEIRRIASLALNLRNDLKIKIRQPLQKLKVKSEKLKVNKQLLDILKEEINVKEIIFDKNINPPDGGEIELDINITPELKEEGVSREIIRQIQNLRAEASLKPRDRISASVYCENKIINAIIKRNESLVKKEINAKTVKIVKDEKSAALKETTFDGNKIFIGIRKLT